MATPHGQLYQWSSSALSTWLTAYEASILLTYTYAEIWSGMSPYSADFGNAQSKLMGPIPVVSGTVKVDRSNVIRRTATNVTMMPDAAGQLLPVANSSAGVFAPYGHELRLFKGYRIPGVVGSPASVTSAAVALPLTVVAGTNDEFHYTAISTGFTTYVLMAPGTYSTIASLAAAMNAAMGVAPNIPFSNFCTVTTSGSSLVVNSIANGTSQDGDQLTTGTGRDVLAALGFTSPATLAGGVADTSVAALGVFLIEEVDVVNDAGGVTLAGTLKDRAQWLARRGFRAPFSTNPAHTADVQINGLLTAVIATSFTFPFLMSLTATTYLPGQGNYNIGDDPWKACCDIAAAAGMQLYFDYIGTLILEPIPPQASTATIVTYNEGTSIAPTAISRVISNAAVPNVICVIGSGSKVKPPVQAFWWDSDSASKTYYAPPPTGGFSPTTPQTSAPAQAGNALYPSMLQKFTTNLVSSAAQAQAVAMAIGLIAIGSLEAGTFSIRDNPAHDVDDVFATQRVIAGLPNGTKEVVDAVNIDLTPLSALQLTTRLIVT